MAEELAGYFVSIGNKDAFAAILYVCFELVRPDFVEEMVSWLISLQPNCVFGGHAGVMWTELIPMACLLVVSVVEIRSGRLLQAISTATSTRSSFESGGP